MADNALFLAEAAGLYECALQSAWNTLPRDSRLQLTSGKTCRIVSHGVWNHAAGPDFLNAAIEFETGGVRRGAVELHCRVSDWIAHGHSADPAYANVILHVVDEDDSTPGDMAFLPDIPVLVLPPALTESANDEGQQKTLCSRYFQRLEDAQVRKFAEDAGLERLRVKSAELLRGMITDGAWRTFQRKFLDLLGVPNNRAQFRTLADRLLAYPEDVLREHYAGILWGESGLLPDPAATPDLPPDALRLVQTRWDEWWPLRQEARPAISFARNTRPLNSIERKLAMADAFTQHYSPDPFPYLFQLLNEPDINTILARLTEAFAADDPFWSTHTSFRSNPLRHRAVLFGRDRIMELLADLLCPSLHAAAALKHDRKAAAKLESLFLALPGAGTNRTIKTMVEYCFPGRERIFRTTASQQGLIHLYRTACEPLAFDCRACRLYRSFHP